MKGHVYIFLYTGNDFFFEIVYLSKVLNISYINFDTGFFFYIWHTLPRKWNLSTQGKFILKAGISKIYFNTLKIEIATEIRLFPEENITKILLRELQSKRQTLSYLFFCE